ncbi:hypothetical protein [Pararhodobacter sp.]|uniref:hypothetical protein n=1 Tax=Pararhodobacter sp. TaxID=2127056 RepID=UPI002FE1DDEA|nr:hypothetical protein [Pseudomonadota bacterium]
MTRFIRPAARAALRRWAETGAALALVLAGLWWGFSGPGPVHWLGWALALLGVGLTIGAVQRALFAAGGLGSGLIEVVEGEVRYFGPRGGGVLALDLMVALSLSADAAYWLVEGKDGTVLVIPRAASGHEALFDAFAALPGFDMARLLRMVAQGPAPRARLVWRHPDRRLLT